MSDMVFLVAIYTIGVVGWDLIRFAEVKLDPALMPGGGKPAIVIASFLWPLVVTLTIVALVLIVAD